MYNIECTVLALEKCFRRHTFENLDLPWAGQSDILPDEKQFNIYMEVITI